MTQLEAQLVIMREIKALRAEGLTFREISHRKGKSKRWADTYWSRHQELLPLLEAEDTRDTSDTPDTDTSDTPDTRDTDPIISAPERPDLSRFSREPLDDPVDDGPGFVAGSTPDDIDRVGFPHSALEFLEMVQAYMAANPDDRLVRKVRRHLPANPEWDGERPTQGDRRGGGWTGAWKDFASLLEKSLRGNT